MSQNTYRYLAHGIILGKGNQHLEITRRIGLTCDAFGKLRHIFKNRDIPINLTRKVYDACIPPVATYGLETSITNNSILGVSLRDKIGTRITDIMKLVAELK